MKALEGAFNQEKALVGAFFVIVKTVCGTDWSFYSTMQDNVVDSNLGLTYLPGRGHSAPGATDLRAGDIRGRRSQMLHRVF